MKYKYAVALLSLTLCTSTLMMNGCGNNTSTSSTDGQVLQRVLHGLTTK